MSFQSVQRRALRALLTLALTLGPRIAPATVPTPAGLIPPEVADAARVGAVGLPGAPAGLGTSVARPNWRIPILMVGFADSPITKTAAEMNAAIFDTTGSTPTGSVVDYYRWVSSDRVRIRGEVVAIVNLPGNKNDYARDSYGLNVIATPQNDYGLVRDAAIFANPLVDWNRYDLDGDGYVDMLWVVHEGIGAELSGSRRDFWSVTASLASGWSNGGAIETDDFLPGSPTQRVRLDRFSMLPERSGFHPGAVSEIGVYCHEFGHALGLPDLYDTSALGGAANVGPGNWSIMSTGAYGGDARSPETPSYFDAWSMLFLGWRSAVRPANDTLMTIAPIESGGPVLEFWFQGEPNPEHFLIENRARLGTDVHLPGEGLVVYHVDEALIGNRILSNQVNVGSTPALRIVEGDGDFDLMSGGNRGDLYDPLPGALGRTLIDDTSVPRLTSLTGAPTNLALRDMARVGADVRALLQVRAPGWQSPRRVTPGPFAALPAVGPARRAAITPTGTMRVVQAEYVGGRAQVTLRSRSFRGDWGMPETVAASPGDAYEPTLTLLPGDDIAVAWTDTRSGRNRIYYRASIQGRWIDPVPMSDAAVDASAPSLAADAHGRVFLAWLELGAAGPRLMLLRFLYASPFGQPTPITGVGEVPTAPALAASADGCAYVLWSDRSGSAQTLWFARSSPDSAVSPRYRLTPPTLHSQPAVQAVVDSSGTLHAVWQVSGASVNEIHYQRRKLSGVPAPRDTAIETLGDGLQNPQIALDLKQGLHVGWERSNGPAQSVRYKRWRPAAGWDFRSTEVPLPDDGSVSLVGLLPNSYGDVSVLYESLSESEPALLERRRELDGGLVLEAPAAPRSQPAVRLIVGPSPLRPGDLLSLRRAGGEPGGSPVDVFDASGRRVASVSLPAERTTWIAGGETARWSPGLYFVRERTGGASARLVVLR